jgi:hypothetical protein
MFGKHYDLCFVRNIEDVLKHGCIKITLGKLKGTNESLSEGKRKKKYYYFKLLMSQLNGIYSAGI